MPARVLLDVDLEDKLLYGLTPMRLAYLLVALLGGYAFWSAPWSPQGIRAAASAAVIALGVAMAWGRWRSRAADQWLSDMAIFAARRYRIVWTGRGRPRFVAWPSKRRQEAISSG